MTVVASATPALTVGVPGGPKGITALLGGLHGPHRLLQARTVNVYDVPLASPVNGAARCDRHGAAAVHLRLEAA